MNIKHVLGVFFALLAFVGVVVVCRVCRSSMPGSDGSPDVKSPVVPPASDVIPMSKQLSAERRSILKTRSVRKNKARLAAGEEPEVDDEEEDEHSPADRRLLDAIEKGRDDDDLDQVVKIIPEASVSTNVEVRSELVDALGWFGVPAMNHLLPFMADADDDVRQSAIDNWTSALGEVEDEQLRAQMIGAVMQVLNDEDALESMTMELIGMDENIALQALVDVIEGGKATKQAVAAAREQYEFLTGDEYTTIDAANQWLAENYEPPVPKDGMDVKERNR